MNIIFTLALRIVVLGIALVVSMLFPTTAEEAYISEPVIEEVLPEVVQPVTPVTLKKIAWCESRNRQFNPDGTVLLGRANPDDVGKWQINKRYHLLESQRLNMDINTLEGNEAYANHLYETQGSKPWNWSAHCWNNPNRVWWEENGDYVSRD